MQHLGRHGGARVVGHARRRGVDQAISLAERLVEPPIVERRRALRPEAPPQAFDQSVGPRAVGVEHMSVAGAEREDRVGHRGPRPASTHDDDALDRGVRKARREALLEPGPVGVMAHRPVGAEDDSVHGSQRSGLRREAVEHGDDGLLARIGDVQALQPVGSSLLDDRADVLDTATELVEVVQVVAIVETEQPPFALVQGRAERTADARADQRDLDPPFAVAVGLVSQHGPHA
jgi:hypothetical protein